MGQLFRLRTLVLLLVGMVAIFLVVVGLRSQRRIRAVRECSAPQFEAGGIRLITDRLPVKSRLTVLSGFGRLNSILLPPHLRSAADYERVLQFPEVQSIFIDRREVVQPEELQVLCDRCPNLQRILIVAPAMAGGTIQCLSRLKHLTELHIRDCAKAPWAEITHSPLIQHLNLCTCKLDANLSIGLQNHPGITNLQLMECVTAGDQRVALPALPHLQKLFITDCKTMDLTQLGGCPELTVLSLTEFSDPDRFLDQLHGLAGLRSLKIFGSHPDTQLRNQDLRHFAQLSSLQRLLVGGNLTDKCEPHLSAMVQLQFLGLFDCNMSDACQQRLRSWLPTTEIRLLTSPRVINRGETVTTP